MIAAFLGHFINLSFSRFVLLSGFLEGLMKIKRTIWIETMVSWLPSVLGVSPGDFPGTVNFLVYFAVHNDCAQCLLPISLQPHCRQ